MRGVQRVKIKNKKIRYDFELHRNITVIRGDSGSGKTSLYDMVAEYTKLGKESGVNVECKKNCVALSDLDWQNQLKGLSDCIVFIDEGFRELSQPEFAKSIRNTDNYYVIFNRENLHELPYSVEEIYEIKTSGKLHTLRKMYKCDSRHIYSGGRRKKEELKILLTEDAKAGFQLYADYFKDFRVECISAEGKTKIFAKMKELRETPLFVVADGAAFGPEMCQVMQFCKAKSGLITLCLPESFEWLVLRSGLVQNAKIDDILENTSDYVDGMMYFSWEQFFAAYLKEVTKDTIFKYSKGKLGKNYKSKTIEEKIIRQIID